MNEKVKEISKEIVSLLYWGMLAACTVGPGTVVTCARSGAEQGLSLAWVLIFATILAFILTVNNQLENHYVHLRIKFFFRKERSGSQLVVEYHLVSV